MKIQVKLFAAAKQQVNSDSLNVDVPDGASIADLRQRIVEHEPALEHLLTSALIAVNHDYVTDEYCVQPTDEIACIPPVSGG